MADAEIGGTPGCKRGAVCRGNFAGDHGLRAVHWMDEYDASVKEMERHAIAHVAHFIIIPSSP